MDLGVALRSKLIDVVSATGGNLFDFMIKILNISRRRKSQKNAPQTKIRSPKEMLPCIFGPRIKESVLISRMS